MRGQGSRPQHDLRGRQQRGRTEGVGRLQDCVQVNGVRGGTKSQVCVQVIFTDSHKSSHKNEVSQVVAKFNPS